MKNCVGWCYTSQVREKTRVIIYAKHKNRHRICIELFPDFTVGQALGPCNKALTGEDLEAYHEWCEEKRIRPRKAFGH